MFLEVASQRRLASYCCGAEAGLRAKRPRLTLRKETGRAEGQQLPETRQDSASTQLVGLQEEEHREPVLSRGRESSFNKRRSQGDETRTSAFPRCVFERTFGEGRAGLLGSRGLRTHSAYSVRHS